MITHSSSEPIQNDWTIPKWSERFMVMQGLRVETMDLTQEWAARRFLRDQAYSPENRYVAHIPRLSLGGKENKRLLAFGGTRQDAANAIVEMHERQVVLKAEFKKTENGRKKYKYKPLIFPSKPSTAPAGP